VKTMEAILKCFRRTGDIMLCLRIFRRGRRVRVYDKEGKEIETEFDYVDVCTTEDEIAFLKKEYPTFYDAVNGHNRDKREKKRALDKFYA
jgi:hypothetical protein